MENTELQVLPIENQTELSFGNKEQFEHAQRVAMAISKSGLIPENYRNNVPNTIIAMEIAGRMKLPAIVIMQHLYVVHGKPSWSGQFTIAAINGCGRFTPLRFEMTGEGEKLQCRAWAKDKETGERLNGTLVTMAMAKGEGWVDKNGSKWKTMPEQMIQYRSGAFFGRVYCPDILMGMPMEEEVEDFTVMLSGQQEAMIENLLRTSAFDEVKQRGILWEVKNGMSAHEAKSRIEYLKENQMSTKDRGSMSAKEIADEIKLK